MYSPRKGGAAAQAEGLAVESKNTERITQEKEEQRRKHRNTKMHLYTKTQESLSVFFFWFHCDVLSGLALASILEPVGPAVFAMEECFAIGKATRHAALAFRRVGAVEEGDMLIPNVAEPVNLALVLKQTQRDTVHGSVAPAFVKEAASLVEVLKVLLVDLAAPKLHVGDFKVAPEVAGREALCGLVVLGTLDVVRHPLVGTVLVDIVRVLGEELLRLGPQRRQRLGVVVQVDGEAVCLVIVLHVAEDIVVDVAEEVHLGLDAPVVTHVLEGRLLVEHAAVPAAHLMV